MKVEGGSYDKPMGKLGEKPAQPWSATSTAAGVDGKPQTGRVVTRVGEIVDFSCYLQLGKHGEKHRSCGQKCAQNSQPVGLLTKAELGRYLYFDRRLSSDGTVSCATCHDPAHGFTDAAAVSTGIRGQRGGRSAPTVINRAYSLAQFWDGRAATLEEQAKGPIANPIEMGNTHETMVMSLGKIQGYAPIFQKVFGTPEITVDRLAQAVATFERTI